MRRFVAMLILGLALSSATGAQAYHRFWADCNDDAPTFMTTMTRDAAQDYANAARYEGYQWGGGCWNYDDVDTYPERPTRRRRNTRRGRRLLRPHVQDVARVDGHLA